MAGSRKPMAVNMAVVGGKHWTKAEKVKRAAEELHLPKPKELKPPKWLSPEAKKLFKAYAKLLLAFPEGIVSELDTGTLARHCIAEVAFNRYSAQHDAFMGTCDTLLLQYSEAGNLCGLAKDEGYIEAQKQVDHWSSLMARVEKICRGCAAALGLTVTSRCKLVVPQVELAPEVDPLAELRDKFLGGQVAADG